MKKTAICLLALCLFSSCAKQEQTKPKKIVRTIRHEEPKWLAYTDPKYPISLQYPDFPALDIKNDQGQNEVQSGRLTEDSQYDITVWTDLRTDFPQDIVDAAIDDDDGRSKIARLDLLRIEICPPELFKEGRVGAFARGESKEIVINSIPMLSVRDEEYPDLEYRNYYLALIPGHYIFIEALTGKYFDEDFPEISSRAAELAQKTLKSIRWNQPIDTDSQEFKAWKAHILSLIEESRQSAKKKSGQ